MKSNYCWGFNLSRHCFDGQSEQSAIVQRYGTSYVHLVLSLVARRKDDGYCERAPFALKWQGHYEAGKGSDWYAAKVELQGDLYDTERCMGISTRIVRKLHEVGMHPRSVATVFEEMKIPFMLRDERPGQKQYVLPKAQLGAEVKGWMPDYDALGWSSCHVACVTEDEDRAKRLLLSKLADPKSWLGYDSVKLTKEFIDAKMPVRLRDDAVQFGTLDELLASPKQILEKREESAA